MTHRLAGYPADVVERPLPAESTLAKMPSLALLSQATRFPNAHAPQNSRERNTAGLQQVHLRPIGFIKPVIACAASTF